MKFTGPTYRPPFEASSLLLQVAAGCSHNRCSFCTMYREVPFHMEPLEQIEKDLDEVKAYAPYIQRVFLENGDPFCLSADRLKAIAEAIHQRLPLVETIAMYASIGNIRSKTDDELHQLRGLGINQLNIGVESGLDEVLTSLNKGYRADEAILQLLRLKAAGMDYGANIILGAAGSGKGADHAIATARLVNETRPYLIFTGTIHADPGCPLYDDLRSGRFVENTLEEYLNEQELFLRRLELEDCYYFGLHPSNIVPMQGRLMEDRDKLLDQLSQARRRMTGEQLRGRPRRYGEGAVVL